MKHHRKLQSSRSSNARMKEAFDLMDRDGDGTIKSEDLMHFLQHSVRTDLCDEDVESMISLADRDGNGAVDFEEFLSLIPQPESAPGNKFLEDMFRVLDRNGDGVLSEADLCGVMGELGQSLSPEEVHDMLRTATGCDRKQVTFEDFCLLMNSQ